MEFAGQVPAECDICASAIKTEFVDGATQLGPWGYMCSTCHKEYGTGLGVGKGQRYLLKGNKWLKADDVAVPKQQPLQQQPLQKQPLQQRPLQQQPLQQQTDFSIKELLEERSDRGKHFRAMLALCDPEQDGLQIMQELGLTAVQVVKYCKGKGRKQSPVDSIPYRPDIDLGPIRP